MKYYRLKDIHGIPIQGEYVKVVLGAAVLVDFATKNVKLGDGVVLYVKKSRADEFMNILMDGIHTESEVDEI